MRKLQNPPKDGPGQPPAPNVWKMALLLGTALALKPGAANAQYIPPPPPQRPDCNPMVSGGSFWSDDAGESIYVSYTDRGCQAEWNAYFGGNRHPTTLGEMMRNAVGNVADNIKATRATLVTELSIDELSTLDSIIPPHTAIINSNEESSAFRSHYASGLPAAFTLECTTMAAAPYLDDDMVQKVKDFVDSLDGTEKKLAAVKIAILNFAYWVAWQACSSTIIQRGGYVGPVEGFSNLPPLRVDSSNPFSLVNGLSDTLISGESESFAILTDLFRSIQSDYDAEHPEEAVPGEGLDIPDAEFHASMNASGRTDARFQIYQEFARSEGLDVTDSVLREAAASHEIIVEAIRRNAANLPELLAADSWEELTSLATSFMSPEEINDITAFVEGTQSVQINPDDCSNPVLLATNYIFQGPLAQLDDYSKEKVISYLMGNIARLMGGPASSFSSLPLIRQSGVIMTTMRELELDVGMDSTLASVAAVLSHVGTQRGASQEVMQQINSPQSASTMMGAADSFLTAEEVADFRGLFGIAQPEPAPAPAQ